MRIPPEARLSRQLNGRGEESDPKTKSTFTKKEILQMLIDVIRAPMNELVKSILEKKTSKKRPQIKQELFFTDGCSRVFGISSAESIVTADALNLGKLFDTFPDQIILCSVWPTKLIQACLIAQLMKKVGVWEEYWDYLTQAIPIEDQRLLLFQTEFPNLAALMRNQAAPLSEQFTKFLDL